MNKSNLAKEISENFASKGVDWIFNNLLFWNTANSQKQNIMVGELTFSVETTRELAGFKLVKAICDKTPHTSELRELDKKLNKLAPERLLYIESPETIQWVWPKRLSSGSKTVEIWAHGRGSLPTFMCQKLSGISFEEKEIRSGVTITQVVNRLRGQFDTTHVTNAFFTDFSSQHESLSKAISGLPDGDAARRYASTLLNRLMFIYFMQKKGFLNNDLDYLSNCLRKMKELNKSNHFYNFYKDLLGRLFGTLGYSDYEIEDSDIRDLIGKVRYINGGIFELQEIERTSEIQIPDSAFEEIFKFFDKYVWHLDTRSTGVDNEINPEIIGYIFEQYINLTTSTGKKKSGAYYTKHDVTSYMTEYTLVLRYLDEIIRLGHTPLDLIAADPKRYLKADLLRGYDFTVDDWVELPAGLKALDANDPSTWSYSNDVNHDSNLQLDHEDWPLTAYRRSEVNQILLGLKNGSVKELNDLVTFNLDTLQLVRDFHDSLNQVSDLENLWNACSKLTVIDPTCGSGAFLFAALEHFEEIYGSLMNAKALNSPGIKPPSYVATSKNHPNARYFIRKHCSLKNLYGTDLMGGAIETAKLRLFLSLASCLETVDELEPLPDLDLNLRQGNLVLGIFSLDDLVAMENAAIGALGETGKQLAASLEGMAGTYDKFLQMSESAGADTAVLKSAFEAQAVPLRSMANELYASALIRNGASVPDWLASREPLHWFIEFPQISKSGGFDVVVGNPPYIYTQRKASNPFDAEMMADFVELYPKTSKCPDFYAICYERSLQLLNSNGRHAFIVPNSLAFSNDFRELRLVISEQNKAEWWSTYGKDPQGLFTPVPVRNTILILGPGKGKFQTVHKIITKESRETLFSTLNYVDCNDEAGDPIVRSGPLKELASFIQQRKRSELEKDSDSNLIYVKGVASNWFPVLLGEPKMLTPKKKIDPDRDYDPLTIKLKESENRNVAIAVLASKLAFFWWQSVGDDYHVKNEHAQALLPLVEIACQDSKLVALANAVVELGRENCFANNRLGALAPNVKWSDVRAATDVFEKALLDSLNLSHLWVDLNIWYKLTARVDSDIAAAIPLSREEVQKTLGW